MTLFIMQTKLVLTWEGNSMVTGVSASIGEYPLDWDTCVDNRSVPTDVFCGKLEKGRHLVDKAIAQYTSGAMSLQDLFIM